VGLIEGVALLADQVVEFTRRQALGGGQRFQAEHPVVDALAAGGLEQLRHPAGGGELGLVAQVLIVELAGERVGVDHFKIVAHHQAEKLVETLPDDAFLLVGVGVPVHHFVAEAAAAATDGVAEDGGTNADAGGADAGFGHAGIVTQAPRVV